MAMATLKFHLCDTKLGWIGLVLSPKGLRATTTPRRGRDEALREVSEMGATEPASEAEAGDLPRRLKAFAEGERVDPSTGSGQGLAATIDWDGLSADGRSVSPGASCGSGITAIRPARSWRRPSTR